MKAHCSFRMLVALAVCLSVAGGASPAPAGERIAAISAADFDRLLGEIKPARGESPWREVPWLTNVTEARRRSVAEDKPLVIFTAADGSPLGRT